MNRALGIIASVLRELGVPIGQPGKASSSEKGSGESDRKVLDSISADGSNTGEKESGDSDSPDSDSTVPGDARANRPLPPVTSVGWTDDGEAAADLSTWCQGTVEAMKALTKGLPFPKYLIDGEPKRGDEFDANDYFTVLRHLSMKPGYVLDYVYNFGGGGGWGHPVLYPRKTDAAPYQSFLEFAGGEDVTPGQPMFHKRYSLGGKGSSEEMMDHLLNYVELDGSPESFFELAILDMLGDQFYRYWHSNYYDAKLVCTDAVLQSLLDSIAGSEAANLVEIDQERMAEVRRTDLEPTVQKRKDGVHVHFMYFTKWGGFYRAEAKIAVQAPHTVMAWQAHKLVDYRIGIVF